MKNNNLIFTNEFNKVLKTEVYNINNSLIIISAFSKINAIKQLDNIINENVKEKILVVRWRYEDLKSGATDLELFNYCKENNWKLYINLDLHAKIYVFDKLKALIGSANLTLSGIGENKSSNLEIMTYIDIDKLNLLKILDIIKFSILFNDELFKKCKNELKKDLNRKSPKINWSLELQNMLYNKEIKLWSDELIFSEYPSDLQQHDKNLLNINDYTTNEEIKVLFSNSKIYKWLLDNVKDYCFFGQLTSKLQNDLLDHNLIYRKDLKSLLRNLFNWINELNLKDFKIDRPNYSQRIRRV